MQSPKDEREFPWRIASKIVLGRLVQSMPEINSALQTFCLTHKVFLGTYVRGQPGGAVVAWGCRFGSIWEMKTERIGSKNWFNEI